MLRLWLRRCSSSPYAVLGVDAEASAAQIRERYLELAKSHHPDVSDAGDTSFARVSEAYRELSDPELRAALDSGIGEQSAAADAEQTAAAAVALAKVGRLADGLATFLRSAPLLLAAAPAPAIEAARELLALAATRGEPHHAQTLAVWGHLKAHGAVDAHACGAWFAIAMRGGHTREAIRAAKLAERQGLEQSHHMQATVRQIRRYAAKLKVDRSTKPGSDGPRAESVK